MKNIATPQLFEQIVEFARQQGGAVENYLFFLVEINGCGS